MIDNFNFEVAFNTNVNSNTPYHLDLNMFASQVVRFSRICSKSNSFISIIKKVLDIIVRKGYDDYKLICCMRRIFSNNINILNKFRFKSGLKVSLEIKKIQL